MDADRIEEFLSEQLGQLFGSVDSIDEDDHLIEGKGVKEMCKFLELFVLNGGRDT